MKLLLVSLFALSSLSAIAACKRELVLGQDATLFKLEMTDTGEISPESNLITEAFGPNVAGKNCKSLLKSMLDKDLSLEIDGEKIDLQIILNVPKDQ